jgi:hypothetical protein
MISWMLVYGWWPREVPCLAAEFLRCWDNASCWGVYSGTMIVEAGLMCMGGAGGMLRFKFRAALPVFACENRA